MTTTTKIKTPAQEMGLIKGVTKVRLIEDDANGRHKLTYVLKQDDGSTCPFFEEFGNPHSMECFSLFRLELLPDEGLSEPVPANVFGIIDIPLPPMIAPAEANTIEVQRPAVSYTVLQQKAVNTFQTMYDEAVKHRQGVSSRLHGGYGICDNIDRFARECDTTEDAMGEVKENLIRQTAIYSGNYSYPVPCPNGGDASSAFCRYSDKWDGEYGANRLLQLGQLIDLIKTKWDDSLARRKTPAFRNGLTVGDMVAYTRREPHTFWVFRRDDESMSPSFHKLGDSDDYTNIDLSYIKKVDQSVLKERGVSEFLADLEAKASEKSDIEKQIAALNKKLGEVNSEIGLLDFGLAKQHKVKRIS